MITFKKSEWITGYNSHGCFASFKEIVEIEQERENEPFISFTEEDIRSYGHYQAIWVARTAIAAFRYAVFAEDFELSEYEFSKKYPKYQEEVCKIDCSNLYVLMDSDDGDEGVLMIDMSNKKD